MAASNTMAQVSTMRTFTFPHPSSLSSKRHNKCALRCAISPPENWRESRRLVSISLVLLNFLPPDAIAGGIFDNYVKRKKLEPLETYVPALILTQFQIKDIDKSLEVEEPQYATFRSILRSGPAASFRSNVRAVAQYASDTGKGKTASDDVDRCLRAVDELDSLLLRASRKDGDISPKLMKEKISIAVNALDSLLKTVPSEMLDKAKAIADAYRTPDSEAAPGELDQEFKELESIL